MGIVFNAVIPIFAIIIAGYLLKRLSFKNQDFWDELDRLTYYLLMPSMLIYKIANANLSSTNEATTSLLIIIFALFFITFLCVFLNLFLKIKATTFTSFFQASIRYNTYIFLAIVEQVYSHEGIVIAALIISFAIPLINILCVSIFAFYLKNKKFSLKKTIYQIMTNPLIIACLIGAILNYIKLDLLFFNDIIKLFGSCAIIMGLLSIGSSLKIKEIKVFELNFLISSFIKLAFFPFFVFIIAQSLNLSKNFSDICILFSAMPTATSSYILAKQLNGDTKFISTSITAQTLISFFSIWTVLILLN